MKAMIFAAGLGTRLKPLTDNMPKALVPIAGKTLLQWQIEQLKSADITDLVINVHHFPDLIISYLQDNNNFGCNILISDERDTLLETGGGLRKAAKLLGNNEPVLVCNVDILSNINIQKLIAAYNPNDMGIVVVSERDTQRYLLFNKENRLLGWTNIITGELRPKNLTEEGAINMNKLAFSGMQILNPRIFEYMDRLAEEIGQKFSLIDLYLNIAEKETLRAYIPEDYRMMDVGKINQISEAEIFAQSLQK